MTADGPASGLPQEAVDAAAEAIEDGALTKLGRDLGTLHRNDIVAAGLTAALPFLRQQWEAELPDPNGLAHLRTANALLEERARVAGLQQAVDKVRALVDAPADRPSVASDIYADGHQNGYELAMTRVHRVLPDVQADDRGTCGHEFHICDAGLNTYDTRCCEQCGHREGK